jgi:hypothetical protein
MTDPDFESIRILRNNRPVESFSWLSPNEVCYLIYEPFDKDSPLKFREDIKDSIIEMIPFFRLTEELVKIILREGGIKLTPLGFLNKKVITELYSHGFIQDELIEKGISKLTREQDSMAISNVHAVVKLAGLAIKTRGKLMLTKKGNKLIERRADLFKVVFMTFTEKFNWCSNDGYTDFDIGQRAWAYSFYLFYRFGKEIRPTQFYCDKYLEAFPTLINLVSGNFLRTPETTFLHCYDTRVLQRFMLWFGFVKIFQSGKFYEPESDSVLVETLVSELFQFDCD